MYREDDFDKVSINRLIRSNSLRPENKDSCRADMVLGSHGLVSLEVLLEIEYYVKEVFASNIDHETLITKDFILNLISRFKLNFNNVNRYMVLINLPYRYGAYVTVFGQAVQSVLAKDPFGVLSKSLACIEESDDLYAQRSKLFCEVTINVKKIGRQRELQISQQQSIEASECRKIVNKYKDYIKNKLSIEAPPKIVRVEFRYTLDTFERLELSRFRADRRAFFNGLRHNAMLRDNSGYIWKLFFDIENGFVMHLLFFYPDNFGLNSADIGTKLGMFWTDVTEGKGEYYNYVKNDSTLSSMLLNVAKGENLIQDTMHEIKTETEVLIECFCNVDQFIRYKGDRKFRSIGRGR